MKSIHQLRSIAALLAALAVGACATNGPDGGPYSTGGYGSGQFGVVQSVEQMRQQGGGIGLGTIAGAVVGGVVGNQVGSGRGNAAATVIGAAGGAYVGHQLEGRQHVDSDRVTVHMDDGSYQTFTESPGAGYRVGDRVRTGNGTMQRY